MTTRRTFLVAAGAVAGSIATAALGKTSPAAGRASGSKRRRLLILGGTKFLGPALVAAARSRGYAITLFNRGKTNPTLFPDLETLIGDRDGKLDILRGRTWDAVIDTSGYVPRHVRESATLLADAVQTYVFISTVSVYADPLAIDADESAPLGKIPDETTEKVTPESYGPLKALCERAAEQAMPGRVTTIRPGLIVGPGDPSDRFTYWPVRVERGGEVLAPGAPSDPILYIDVRDLAEWTLHTVDQSILGVYNALGPAGTLTIGELLAGCQQASVSDPRMVWVSADFLKEKKVAAWSDMPVWVPPVGEGAGMGRISRRRAVARGLTFRPVAVTAKDTLAWWHTLPTERRAKLRAGISPEREAEVLAAWQKRATR